MKTRLMLFIVAVGALISSPVLAITPVPDYIVKLHKTSPGHYFGENSRYKAEIVVTPARPVTSGDTEFVVTLRKRSNVNDETGTLVSSGRIDGSFKSDGFSSAYLGSGKLQNGVAKINYSFSKFKPWDHEINFEYLDDSDSAIMVLPLAVGSPIIYFWLPALALGLIVSILALSRKGKEKSKTKRRP